MIEDENTQDSITSNLQKIGLDFHVIETVPVVPPPTEAEFAQARKHITLEKTKL